ncbi:MAG: MurR/RpiR family transcriptional regulator [Rubellimicrobium sp.]|nr:MurR/RpiR family transcriptional regulator [Rubellimicrobium sp.]
MGVVPDIVDLIHRSVRSMRDSERQVADVVLADLQFAMTASASEIAAKADVSTASITRFCRALGFDNMREFKLCVAQNLAISSHFMSNSVARSDSFGELVRSVTDGLGAAIVEAAKDIDVDSLAKALAIISTARLIHVLPMDIESAGNSTDLFNQMLRLGTSTSYHALPEEQRMVVTASSDDSAFMVLSAEPANRDVLELFEAIAQKDLPAILIAPGLPVGTMFPGVHLKIGPSITQDLFARSSRRYKQSVVVELLCTGSSLELGRGLRRDSALLLDQPSPPIKR